MLKISAFCFLFFQIFAGLCIGSGYQVTPKATKCCSFSLCSTFFVYQKFK